MGSRGIVPPFLTSALNAVSRSGHFASGEITRGTQCIGRWVVPPTPSGSCGLEKNLLFLPGIETRSSSPWTIAIPTGLSWQGKQKYSEKKTCYLLAWLILRPLKLKSICSSETLVDFQRIIRRYIAERISLRNQRCENIKSLEFLEHLNTSEEGFGSMGTVISYDASAVPLLPSLTSEFQ
jgi:hypothetical protein